MVTGILFRRLRTQRICRFQITQEHSKFVIRVSQAANKTAYFGHHIGMRKNTMSIEEAKKHIQALRGTPLRISVNKGRKKVLRYDGQIADVYPSVFTLQISDDENTNMLSCSYSDIICGDIELVIVG